MLKNYLKIAIRNFRKYRSYSIINILGLAVGLSCCILILLWVQNELSWDKFHSKVDNIYHVYINRPGDSGPYTQTVVPLGLWDALQEVPGIKRVSPTDNHPDELLLTYDEKRLERNCHYATPDFLQMFDFELIKGTLENQLTDPSSIVLTQATAESLFGNEDPMGKVILVNNELNLTVSGVLANPPLNSSIQFDCLVPFKTLIAHDRNVASSLSNFGNSSWSINVELEEAAKAQDVEERIKDMIIRNANRPGYELALFPFRDTHLYSEFKNGKSVGGAIEYVRIFSIVAFLILGLACINFMNLSTARSEGRGKEIGIRKTIGSAKVQLIIQFLIETALMTTLAFIIAIGLVELAMPYFNLLVNKQLFIDYSQPTIWLAAFGFVFLTSFIAGGYPAFFLSSLKPIRVLKGKLKLGNHGHLPRQILVTMQYVCSIGLIVSTIVIFKQINHVKNRKIGYDKENLLSIPATGEVRENYQLIKSELLDRSLATSVTRSSNTITNISAWSKPDWRGKTEDQDTYFAIVAAGHDYTTTLDSKILLGREFNSNYNDSLSVLLNKAAQEYMGLTDPIGEVIRLGERQYTVVGVIDDLVMGSPYRPAKWTIFRYNESWTTSVMIRIPSNRDISETLSEIEDVFVKYNPEFPFAYSFVDQAFNEKFLAEERIGKFARIFALLAIFISFLGVFGLSAFTASQRTKEVGIRKVMGARLIHIVSLLSIDFTRLTVIAFAISAPVAWWLLTQWLEEYTYRIAVEWWMLLIGGGMVLLLTWIIVGFQAHRVSEINPTQSLKEE